MPCWLRCMWHRSPNFFTVTQSAAMKNIPEPREISPDSPCIGHCTTVLGDDVCRNCLRTFEEITDWVLMDEAQRRSVNQRIADLHSQRNK